MEHNDKYWIPLSTIRAEWRYACTYRGCTDTLEEYEDGVLEDLAVDRAQDAYIRRCEPED